jgi:hypothetical protein
MGKRKCVFNVEHRSAINATASANIRDFLKPKMEITITDLECAAKEATFAYHTARHELSFKTSDCTSKLIKKLYDPKFSSVRTKTISEKKSCLVKNTTEYIKFNVSVNC